MTYTLTQARTHAAALVLYPLVMADIKHLNVMKSTIKIKKIKTTTKTEYKHALSE